MITSILVFVLTYLISSNNLALCIGYALSTKVLSIRKLIYIAISAYIIGVLLEGYKMSASLLENFNYINHYMDIALIITIVIFIVSEIVRIPASLITLLYSGIFGVEYAITGRYINVFAITIIYWIFISLTSMIISYLMYRFTVYLSKFNLFRSIVISRALIIALLFLTSYSFSANNFGLLWGIENFDLMNLTFIILGFLLGTLVGSKRTLVKYAYGFYTLSPLASLAIYVSIFTAMELSTQLSIPVGLTIIALSSTLGTEYAHKLRLASMKYVKYIIITYTSSIILGFATSYLTSMLIIGKY